MSTLSTEPDLEADASVLRPVLCLDEAAELLGISRSLMLQEIKRGNVPHKRLGRRLVFSRQRLLEWLANDES